MSKLDIRKHPVATIDCIQFADDYSSVTGVRGDCVSEINCLADDKRLGQYLYLASPCGESVSVKMSDIDNLVIALYKARELWMEI